MFEKSQPHFEAGTFSMGERCASSPWPEAHLAWSFTSR